MMMGLHRVDVLMEFILYMFLWPTLLDSKPLVLVSSELWGKLDDYLITLLIF